MATLIVGLLIIVCCNAHTLGSGPPLEREHVKLRVNPNRATVAQLVVIPGLGPTLARRIIQTSHQAPFRDSGDLLQVRGIGPFRLSMITEYLDFQALGDGTDPALERMIDVPTPQ